MDIPHKGYWVAISIPLTMSLHNISGHHPCADSLSAGGVLSFISLIKFIGLFSFHYNLGKLVIVVHVPLFREVRAISS